MFMFLNMAEPIKVWLALSAECNFGCSEAHLSTTERNVDISDNFH